jgi:hypothetical protein
VGPTKPSSTSLRTHNEPVREDRLVETACCLLLTA